jgi:putative iron-only hydrogenase system regulator
MVPRQQSTRVGFVGIIIDDRKKSSEQVNRILSEFGSLIVSRTGMPYPKKNCCVITLIVDARNDQIGALAGKLGQIEGVSVKSALSKEK